MAGITTDKLQVLITSDTSSLKKGLSGVNSQLGGLQKSTSQFSAKSAAAFAAVTSVITVGLNKAMRVIGDTMGTAISRVDTLNNSARTFNNMGFDTDKSERAIKALNDSLLGLPTSLDSGIRGMTSLAATYGDIDKGQKVFSALNNAILGFGGSASEVDNAILQLSQVPMDGPLDAQTWRSLRNSGLTPVLVAMSKDMGVSVDVLKTKLGEGDLTVKDFTDRLIKMDKDGGGGMKSLAQIAQDSTKGIATGFANAKTAVARGMANIIQSIGSAKISKVIKDFGAGFEGMLESVSDIIPVVKEFAKKSIDYLRPKLERLSKVISEKVLPPLEDLWKKVIKPMIPVIAKGLVGAFGAVVDITTDVIKGISNIIDEFKKGNPWILTLAGAFGVLAGVMAFNAIFNALKVGFATLRLVTIPSMVASLQTIATSSAGVAVKMIANFIKMSVSAVINAVKSAAAWVASAASATYAWVVQTIPKIIAAFSLTALKSYVHAADTALAWTINAARVSFVWVTQEMPKLIVSFIATSASAVVQALKTSAAWVASAVKTSTVWVITEMPKIVGSFLLASGKAVVHALITSAAWVASASTSAVAWVVTQLPRIIAAFVAMAASAVANAAIVSGAWVAAAATGSASFTALAALIATPLVMPAIVVAAAIGALFLVQQAAQRASDAVAGAQKAADQSQQIRNDMYARNRQVQADPSSSPELKARWKQSIINIGRNIGQNAQGTNNWRGGMTWIGEKGPELVNLPKGSKVFPHNTSVNMSSNKMIGSSSSSPSNSKQMDNQNQPMQTIIVKIGEDTLINKVVKGINNMSYMNNETVLEV